MFNQIYNFIEYNKLIHKSQYEFRTVHSTELAILELVEQIIKGMDKNEIPINIYLDLSTAFDVLDHEIILNKLNYYEIRETAFELLSSYLSNRKQYVEIDDINL